MLEWGEYGHFARPSTDFVTLLISWIFLQEHFGLKALVPHANIRSLKIVKKILLIYCNLLLLYYTLILKTMAIIINDIWCYLWDTRTFTKLWQSSSVWPFTWHIPISLGVAFQVAFSNLLKPFRSRRYSVSRAPTTS